MCVSVTKITISARGCIFREGSSTYSHDEPTDSENDANGGTWFSWEDELGKGLYATTKKTKSRVTKTTHNVNISMRGNGAGVRENGYL